MTNQPTDISFGKFQMPISTSSHPIDFKFGSKVRFSQMAIFPFRSNPRWRPAHCDIICKKCYVVLIMYKSTHTHPNIHDNVTMWLLLQTIVCLQWYNWYWIVENTALLWPA